MKLFPVLLFLNLSISIIIILNFQMAKANLPVSSAPSDIIRMISPETIVEAGDINYDETKKTFDDIFTDLDAEFKILKVRINSNHLNGENEFAIYDLISHRKISPNEVVRLFETGAVKIEEGPLRGAIAELKIGDTYGEAFVSTDILEDAYRVQRVQQYLSFLNTITHLIWLSPNSGPGSQASVNPNNAWGSYLFSPNSLSASIFGNHYLENRNASIATSAFVNPLGFTPTLSYSTNQREIGWWGYLTDGYLGSGFSYKLNLDKGQFPGVPEGGFIGIGGSLAGWNNFVRAGISFTTLLSDGIGIGVGALISYSRDYNRIFAGFAPLDHRIRSIRGKAGVIINSIQGAGMRFVVAANGSLGDVPIAVAVRTDINANKTISYKTYVENPIAKYELEKFELPGLLTDLDLRLKKIKIPKLTHPDDLKAGDVVKIRVATEISAAFVVGIEAYTSIAGARAGVSQTIKGIFNIEVYKYPHNKIEVSISPEMVAEASVYLDLLNTLGAAVGHGVAFAYKKKYLFDLDNDVGRERYYEFINTGRLHSEIDDYVDLNPSDLTNFITMLQKYNKREIKNGTLHLEDEVMITDANKFRAGVDVPLLDGVIKWVMPKNVSKLWSGLSIEHLSGISKTFSYNDRVAVVRDIEESTTALHELFSGTSTKRLVSALKVFHYSNKDIEGHKFGGLLISLQLSDTAITGMEKIKLVDSVNHYFDLRIPIPKEIGDYRPLDIKIEKLIGHSELLKLTNPEQMDVAKAIAKVNQLLPNFAVRAIQLDYFSLTEGVLRGLLEELQENQLDRLAQGKIIQRFVSNYGINGFASIFYLLGAKDEDISLTISSNYLDDLNDFEKFKVFWTPTLNSENNDSDDLKDAKDLEEKIMKRLSGSEVNPMDLSHKIKKHERMLVRKFLGIESERTLDLFLRAEEGGTEKKKFGNKFLEDLRRFIEDSNEKLSEGKVKLVNLNKEESTDQLRRFYREAGNHLRKMFKTIYDIDKEVFLIDETFSFLSLLNKDSFKTRILDRNIRQTKQSLSQPLAKAMIEAFNFVDLKRQGFDKQERLNIYKRVNKTYIDMRAKGNIPQFKPSDLIYDKTYNPKYIKNINMLRPAVHFFSLLDYPQRWELLKNSNLGSSLEVSDYLSSEGKKILKEIFLLRLEVESEKEQYDLLCMHGKMLNRLAKELCDYRIPVLNKVITSIDKKVDFNKVDLAKINKIMKLINKYKDSSIPLPVTSALSTLDIYYSVGGFFDQLIYRKFKNHP